MQEVDLNPGDSVFVQSIEEIHMPQDMIARVSLRNSRIREGLSLDAPVYYPGHETKVFFRVTNVSAQKIHIECAKGLSSIMFEKLEKKPDASYNGTFQSEMQFTDMASYTERYSAEISSLKKEEEKLESVESRLYSNVATILTIFVGIFSLINVNVGLVAQEAVSTGRLLLFNLATVASICVLTGLVQLIFPKKRRLATIVSFGVALICFAAALAVQFFLN